MAGLIRLRSGAWRCRIERDAGGAEFLALSLTTGVGHRMRVHLPFSWRALDESLLTELARKPEVRIWPDEHGLIWRVAAVGPGTRYPFPFAGRYLVFDSESTWSGITPAEAPPELGDMTDDELRAMRDTMSDIGGGRQGFRPPDPVSS